MGIRSALLLLSGLLMLGTTAIQAAETRDVAGGPHATRSHVPLLYDNLVLNWNETMLAAVRANPPRPTVTARNLHLVHAAMYDAWAAYDATAVGTRYGDGLRRPQAERTEANKAIAVSHAAHRVASVLYPNNRNLFDAMMQAQDETPDWDNRDPANPIGIANLAAEAILAHWAEDGSNWQANFKDPEGYTPINTPEMRPGAPGYDPNRWQPLKVPTGKIKDGFGNPAITENPASYGVQSYLTPHWGEVRPFAMPSGDAVRPVAPPRYGDHSPYVDARGKRTTNHKAWVEQFGEVLKLHATLDDPGIGARRRCIAEFWADGPRSDTPPGHWNQLAQGIALREGYGIDETVTLYFALTGAMHDAAIAAWDAKYVYDFNRPVTAIRHHWAEATVVSWMGPNRGVGTMPGSAWIPYQQATFVTPAFPEYVSGHSTFSMAGATTIAGFVGDDTLYDPYNPTPIVLDLDDEPGPDILGRFVDKDLTFESYDGEPMVLQWLTLFDAARQAGDSRLYGGIHIQDANLRGSEMGAKIGQMALERATTFFTGSARIEDPASLANPPRAPKGLR